MNNKQLETALRTVKNYVDRNFLNTSGGTVKGDTVLEKGYRVHKATGTSGSTGYVIIARIKITANYQNQPIIMQIAQRGRNFSTLEIQFNSVNNTDPTLKRFYKTGEISAYIYKSSTSTWDVYIAKSEGYDSVDVVGFSKGSYMSGTTITWQNTHSTTVPSGYTEAIFKTEGNAVTATKLATARTLSWTGDATGSLSFDGSANKSATLTLSKSGVTAGNYGPGSNASPSHGGTFNVPYITVDAKGRVTSAVTRTITLPTDTKVTNKLSTTTKAYITGTPSSTTNTGDQIFDTGVYLDTTAGQLTATTFKGSLSGNASSATKLQNSRAIRLNGMVSGSVNFNGTADANISTVITSPKSGDWWNGGIVVTGTNGVSEMGRYIDFHNTDTTTSDYSTRLQSNGDTANTVSLPTKSGTLALTSDNVASATKLQNSRKINGVDFNGTADVSVPLVTFKSYLGNDNSKPYHRILSSGVITGTYQDKSIIVMANGGYSGGPFGIFRVVLRTNASNTKSTCDIEWLVRKGFSTSNIVVNMINTPGSTVADIFYKAPNTYASINWTVLTEGGARGNGYSASAWTKYNTSATTTEVYTEDGMKKLRSYTSTLVKGSDTGAVKQAEIASSCTGNAATATKFASKQSVTLSGDVTGTASSQAGWSIATTLKNSGVTAGSYGPSANASPGHKGTFSVPYITVDAKGRVTSAATRTITLPSDNNTDTKVTNTVNTGTKYYLTGTTSASTNTGTQVFDTGIYSTTTAGQLQVTGGLISGSTVRSDTAVTDDLGSASIPWRYNYSKFFDVYGEASKSYGSLRATTIGTTSTTGETRLTLGNSTAKGTASNSYGRICMYGTNTGYTWITPGHNSTGGITLTLPSAGGTLARTADNVASATKLANARNIKLTGDVTGSASFNGTADASITATVADNSHNHTSLTGVTSLTFGAESTDAASIKTTISSATTYFDFKLSDDANADAWRWRFAPAGGSEFNAMYLSATGNGTSQLSVPGKIQGTTITASGNSKTATVGTGGADIYLTNSKSGKYLQLKDDGTLAYSDAKVALNYNSIERLTATNWWYSTGKTGWYNETYGGGWYMEDSTWVRSYANKNIYTAGTMRADGEFSCIRGSGDTYLVTQRTDTGVICKFGIGTGGTNHGIYSNAFEKWIVYGDSKNVRANYLVQNGGSTGNWAHYAVRVGSGLGGAAGYITYSW